jgi:prolyl-tRNA synthetase
MANKEKVQEITSRDEDFAQWYTDIILKTEMVDYSPVKGFMTIRPYGYAIWENIQAAYDKRFKETGHKNMYFPLLIPESLLQKEAEHVEGFAPEVAWVTHGGNEKLAERLAIRPTSETIICSMYSKWLKSWRELPYLYNQWCSVVRWEKSTRPFLRTSEFLWQEGHTLHETYEEAQEETLQMLDIYRDVAEKHLAIPMVVGRKSEKEKFAGAFATYTMEALMHDGKALQSGTSHNLGQHFTKAFDITYTGREGDIEYPYHTSWGLSTRLIGGLIMVHSDDNGLVLPPKIAPTQVVVIPVAQHKEGVLDKAYEIKKQLEEQFRVEIDDSDGYSPGWKFNQWEMKGVPIRLEIGPRDIKNNQVVIARRDNGEKTILSMDNLNESIQKQLEDVQQSLFNKAVNMRDQKTYVAKDIDEFTNIINNTPGFIKAMWCEDRDCEDKIKEDTVASVRCIPFDQEDLGTNKCVCCGKEAKKMAYFAKAY